MEQTVPIMDALFRVKVPVTIGGTTLWLRALSDFSVQARDEFQLLAMARRRREIENSVSDAHELYIVSAKEAPLEELVESLVSVAEYETRRMAMRDSQPRMFPFPDDASDEEKARVLKQREDERERIASEIAKKVSDFGAKYRAEIATRSRDELIKLVQGKQLEQQARLTALQAFQDYTLFAATFTDEACESPLFKSPTAVAQLDPRVRMRLVSDYFEKVDTFSPLDLQYAFSTVGSRESAKPMEPSVVKPNASAEKAQKTSRGGGLKSS